MLTETASQQNGVQYKEPRKERRFTRRTTITDETVRMPIIWQNYIHKMDTPIEEGEEWQEIKKIKLLNIQKIRQTNNDCVKEDSCPFHHDEQNATWR